jgi:hypothetical protein
MEQENHEHLHIEKFFDPKDVVGIGASPNENSVGYKVMNKNNMVILSTIKFFP